MTGKAVVRDLGRGWRERTGAYTDEYVLERLDDQPAFTPWELTGGESFVVQ